MFFKKLVHRKNDQVEFEMITKTNEKYISVTYGRIRLMDSYRFISSSLDSLVRTLVDINLKTLKSLKKEIVDNGEISDIVKEIGEEDRTNENLKKGYPNEIEKLEEVLLNYIGENDSKLL